MRRSFFRLLLFFLFFNLEVQVQAQGLIQSPEACDGMGSSPCVYKNSSAYTHKLKLPTMTVSFTPQSLLRIENGEVKLLKGKFLISCPKYCRLSTVWLNGLSVYEGLAYFYSDLKKTTSLSLLGSLVLPSEGFGTFKLLPGMEQVTSSKSLKSKGVGVPQMISPEKLSQRLSQFLQQPEEMLSQVLAQMPASADVLAIELKGSVQRQIASEIESRRQKELRNKKYNQESKRLRKLFREKNFL